MRKTQATGTDQLMHISNLLESYCIVTVLWEGQRTRLGKWEQIHTYGAPGTNTQKNISTPATTVPFARYNNGSIAFGYQTLPSLLPWTILYMTSGARNPGRDTFYPASRLRLQNSLNARKRFRGQSVKHSPASNQQMDSTLPLLFHSPENLDAMDKMLWIMLFAFLIRKLESSCSTSHRLTPGKAHPSWAIMENQKGS